MTTNTRKQAARPSGASSASPAPFTFSHYSCVYESRPAERNEDMVLIDRRRALAAIFDGVGGSEGLGQIASQLAARVLRRAWRRVLASVQAEPALLEARITPDLSETLRLLLEEANEQIRTEGLRQARLKRPTSQDKEKIPATTVALTVFSRKAPYSAANAALAAGTNAPMRLRGSNSEQPGYIMTYAHVGDSRIYLLQDHEPLRRLTQDDGYFSLLLGKGAIKEEDALRIDQAMSADQLSEKELSYFNRRNGITQALGDVALTIHLAQTTIAPGDRILLCTDGIHDNLIDQELEDILRRGARTTVARKLVQRAIERSHEDDESTIRAKKDDMSAIVITCNT